MNRAIAIPVSALLMFLAFGAPAATFTYTRTASNTAGAPDLWSAGTSWDLAPLGASNTRLVLGNGAALASGATLFTRNDLPGDFQLNALAFTYAGPLSGVAPSATISGNRLEFVSDGATAPTISLTQTGGVRPVLTLQNDVLLTNGLAVSGFAASANGLVLTGTISGAGSLSTANAGLTLVGADTYSGGTTLSSGLLNINGAIFSPTASAIGTGTFTINGGVIQNTNAINSVRLGTNNPMIWNGNFTLANGTNNLHLGDGAVTLTGNRQVTVDGNVRIDTVGGVIGDGGSGFSLTKDGIGTLVLNGASTYSGGTTILGGRIQASSLGNAGEVGNVGTGTINISGTGTLFYSGFGETSNKPIVISGNTGSASLDSHIETAVGPLVLAGDVTSTSTAAAKQLTLQGGGTGEIAGRIFDNGPTHRTEVNKSGNGTWTLSGANPYSGKTTILSGTLSASSLNSVVGGVAASSLGAPITVATGTIDLGAPFSSGSARLRYTGAGETTDRVINLVGPGGTGILEQAGSGLLRFTSDLSATGSGGGGTPSLTLDGSTAGAGEFAARIVDNMNLSTTQVIKRGTGVWTLSGANTYTGGTGVVEGTLLVDGDQSAATGTVNVLPFGTLGGTGTLGGSVVVQGGTLSPGASASAGTLHVGGSLTLQTDSDYRVELDAPGAFDLTDVSGDVTLLDAALVLNTHFTPDVGTQFTIIENGGIDPVLGTFAALPEGAHFAAGGTSFAISYQGGTGNDVVLTAVVPEPAPWGLLGAALYGATLISRRQRRSAPGASRPAVPRVRASASESASPIDGSIARLK